MINKLNVMKKVKSKREILLNAILSRDKIKLQEALQVGKPEKWYSFSIDKDENITLQGKKITKQEFDDFIKEEEKTYKVCLIKMVYHTLKHGNREEKWYLGGRELTLDLK